MKRKKYIYIWNGILKELEGRKTLGLRKKPGTGYDWMQRGCSVRQNCCVRRSLGNELEWKGGVVIRV